MRKFYLKQNSSNTEGLSTDLTGNNQAHTVICFDSGGTVTLRRESKPAKTLSQDALNEWESVSESDFIIRMPGVTSFILTGIPMSRINQ